MAKLSTAARKKLRPGQFAIPAKAGSAKARAKSGNYPIEDKAHARNALSRVAQHGTSAQKAKVRAAVKRKYPDIGSSR